MLLRPCSGDSPSLAGNGKWSFTCANLTDKATTRRHLCSSKQPDTNLLLALTSSSFKVQPSVIGERQGGGLIPACSLLCHTSHLTPCSSISIVLAYNTKHNAAGKAGRGPFINDAPEMRPILEIRMVPKPGSLGTIGFLSGRRDLNPRPLDPQSSALPNCATARQCISTE